MTAIQTLQSLGALCSISGILLLIFNLNIALEGLNIILFLGFHAPPLSIPSLSVSGAFVSGGLLGFLSPWQSLIFFMLGIVLFVSGLYGLQKASEG